MQALLGCRQRPSVDLVGPGGIALERLDGDASITEAAGAEARAPPPRSTSNPRGAATTKAAIARPSAVLPAVHVVTDFRSDITAASAADAAACGRLSIQFSRPRVRL